jgi:site-specific recombinase XerD
VIKVLNIAQSDTFIDHLVASGRKIAESYGCLLRNFEEWLKQRERNLDTFTPADVEEYMSNLNKGTANVFLAAIRKYAKFRVSMANDGSFVFEDRRYHSLEEIKYRKIPQKIEKRSLTPEEVAKLIELTEYDPVLQSAVVTTFYFGWRPIEATEKLNRARIKWDKRYIILQTAKSGNERLLPWHPLITSYLKAWYRSLDEILSLRNYDEWLTKKLKHYQKPLHFPVTAKTARRSFETQMKKQGTEQWKIDFLMGHAVRVPDVYSDWTELLDEFREPMEEKHYMIEVIA